MKKVCRISTWIIVLSALILLNGCHDDNPVNLSDLISSVPNAVLMDTLLVSNNRDVSVTVNQKISITIPAGTVQNGSRLTIMEVAPSNIPQDSENEYYEVFDVKINTAATFSNPLRMTIQYNPLKVPNGKFKSSIGVSYYSETLQRWILFNNCTIDTNRHSITFETTHLTKLGRFGWRNLEGYTDYSSSSHFYVYWKGGDVPSNTEYISPYHSVNVGTDPDYIQDMLYFLETSYTAFKNTHKLTVPTKKVDVYVKDLGSDDGNSSFFGYLNINQRVGGVTRTDPMDQALAKVCAHEFLHYIQDYYYVLFAVGNYTKWWLEATATQADRMVWPNTLPSYEAVQYASGNVESMCHKSWDDCNADPDYYIAGGFLTYLSTYTSSPHVKIADLIKLGGSNTDLSYMRTIIDQQLQTIGISGGIQSEFNNYIKWCYEGTGPIKMNKSPILKSTNLPWVTPVILTASENSAVTSKTLPYLSARMIKIRNDDTTKNNVIVKAEAVHEDDLLWIYKCTGSTRTDIGQLIEGDSLSVGLVKSEWLDCLVVNGSKDEGHDVILHMRLLDDQLNGTWLIQSTVISNDDPNGVVPSESAEQRFTVLSSTSLNIYDVINGYNNIWDFSKNTDGKTFTYWHHGTTSSSKYTCTMVDNDHWTGIKEYTWTYTLFGSTVNSTMKASLTATRK
jgi:hypothetical protein